MSHDPAADAMLDERRLAIRRAAAIGGAAWAAFLLFDILVQQLLYPQASLAWCAMWRGVGCVVAIGAFAVTRHQRPNMALFRRTAILTLAALSLTLGLIGAELGGLASPYVHGFTFIITAAAVFIADNWRMMTRMLAPSFVAFFAGLALGVAFNPAYAGQFQSEAALAHLGVNTVLLMGLATFSIIGGHRQWRARMQIADVRRLGRYRLESLLGRGGMNEVWLARDTALPRTVALKLLRATHPDDVRFRRFELEAQATSRLKSPYTVRILDFGTNTIDGTAWIAMEHLSGRDLADIIERAGPLPLSRALHFARMASESLAEAHAAGLIHRDIKPANLFICKDPPPADTLKVIDFGIARDAVAGDAHLTRAGHIIGTPAFMAPELLMGRAADSRTDVYAFGVTLFAMLTGGVVPADVLDANHLLNPEARRQVPPPSTFRDAPIPTDVERFVMRCLAFDPAQRPADGQALLDELEPLHAERWTSNDAESAWRALGHTNANDLMAADTAATEVPPV